MLDQDDLNREMVEIGIGRFNAQWNKAKESEKISRSKAGQRLLRDLLPEYTKQVATLLERSKGRPTRWKEDLQRFDPKVLAFVAIKVIMDSIAFKKTMAATSYWVGRMIEHEVKCQFLVDTNPEKGKGIILGAKRRVTSSQMRHIQLSMRNEAKKKGMPEFEDWSRKDRVSCGMNFVELLRASTGLIEYYYFTEKGRKYPTRFVSATPETLQWVADFNSYHAVLEPFWMPTLDPPVDWKNVWVGGYRPSETLNLPQTPFIKTADSSFLRMIKPTDMKIPREAVNLIQRTPWEINERVFDVVEWAWNNGVPIKGLPEQDDMPIPPFPEDGEENKHVRDKWAKVARVIHKRNLSTRSKRMLTSKILRLASKFKGERFFLPSNCDFRGRVYNTPVFLNPQGPDLCRGLLQFYREERIKSAEGAKWLAIHGANCWGYDKVSLEDRIKWSYDFGEDAIKIASDPKSFTLWLDADKPFSFLAWVFEWAEYYENFKKGKHRLKTKIPVMMDATNNGLQILSILTRCDYGTVATNCTPSSTNTPADIYDVVKVRAESRMREDAANNHPYAATWLEYGINRSTTKKCVMCFPYGLSKYSSRQYIADWFDDKIHGDQCPSPFDQKEYYKAVHYLNDKVWSAIEEVLDLPKRCMDWFQEVSKIACNNGQPLWWKTPSGFFVKQSYKKIKDSKVSTWISGEAIHIKFNNTTDQLSPRKQANGVAPNVTHSLDSSLLHLTVVSANKGTKQHKGIYDFSMIHDSYGTHSPNCQFLAEVIRDEAVKMFTPDLLRDWLDQIRKQNPGIEFPEPPTYGSADVSLIRDSPFFFS